MQVKAGTHLYAQGVDRSGATLDPVVCDWYVRENARRGTSRRQDLLHIREEPGWPVPWRRGQAATDLLEIAVTIGIGIEIGAYEGKTRLPQLSGKGIDPETRYRFRFR